MTARLPTVASDNGTWGTVLNDFLTVGHNADGTTIVDAASVTYTPADNTKWTGSVDPGNVNVGLDQIASRVEAVEANGASFYGITAINAVPSTGWTWENQSTSSIASASGVESMVAVASGSEWRLRYRTPVNSHWSIKVLIAAAGASGSVFGIGFRDSAGKLFMIDYYLSNVLYAMHWNSSTSFSSSAYQTVLAPVYSPIWMRADYDGTNVSLFYSIDSVAWVTIFTETRATFLAAGTPNFCWGADCIGGQMSVSLLSYLETALP